MATMTMTEFNRNPSAAARIARTEPVIVTERGRAAFEYRAVKPAVSRLDELIAAGLVRPARLHGPIVNSEPTLDPAVGREIYEQFWADREARDY